MSEQLYESRGKIGELTKKLIESENQINDLITKSSGIEKIKKIKFLKFYIQFQLQFFQGENGKFLFELWNPI